MAPLLTAFTLEIIKMVFKSSTSGNYEVFPVFPKSPSYNADDNITLPWAEEIWYSGTLYNRAK